MNNEEKMYYDAIEEWRQNKGIGQAIMPAPLRPEVLILAILEKIYEKNPNTKTIIICSAWNERQFLIDFITNQGNDNDKEFKELLKTNIKLFTFNYLDDKRANADLCIVYNLRKYADSVKDLFVNSKFKLAVFNTLMMDTDSIISLENDAPTLKAFKLNQLAELKALSPVEEIRYEVFIEDAKDTKLHNDYNEFINRSMTIFGDIGDTLNKAISGDSANNVSAIEFCTQLAMTNGWSPDLDMSFEFNRDIDACYNPSILHDRATMTYDIIRKRINFLASYKDKLKAIIDILDKNKDSKFIIINKSGEFAEYITTNLKNAGYRVGSVHDKIPTIPQVDIDGNPVFYKSGSNKGERKMMGYAAQSSLAIQKYETNKINILSCNNSINADYKFGIDAVIITSPKCKILKEFLFRMSKTYLLNPRIKLFTIYIAESVESKAIYNRQNSDNIALMDTIYINKCENDEIY